MNPSEIGKFDLKIYIFLTLNVSKAGSLILKLTSWKSWYHPWTKREKEIAVQSLHEPRQSNYNLFKKSNFKKEIELCKHTSRKNEVHRFLIDSTDRMERSNGKCTTGNKS